MSRDYSPAELVQQSFYDFKDFWVGNDRINNGPDLPEAVFLPIPRDRTIRTHGDEIGFHPLQGADIWSDRIPNLGKIPSDGSTPGMAMNLGYMDRNRTIKVGRFSNEYNESYNGDIPVDGDAWVWYTGWPGRDLSDDRSTAFVKPDGSIVHIWQWISKPGEYAFTPNHAASIGHFNPQGEIIGGTGGGTAAKTSWAMTTDTPDSLDPEDESNWGLSSAFVCCYPLYDALGRLADGLLTKRAGVNGVPPIDINGRPLHLRDILLLKQDSETFEINYNAGGHRRARATKLSRYGLLIDDQRGFAGDRENGTPRAGRIRTQACSNWSKNSNLKDFVFKFEDFTLANEQTLNFTPAVVPGTTTPVNPGTPTNPGNGGGSGAGCMPGSTLIAKLFRI